MADRPIIFSAPMVRALLDGRKARTRRLAWTLPKPNGARSAGESIDRGGFAKPTPWQKVRPGDRLWIREAWRTLQTWDCLAPRQLADDPKKITFEADPEHRNPLWAFGKLRPAIHMPRWASRITLRVTEVRRQRLHEITDADARAEGTTIVEGGLRPVEAFMQLWDHLHGGGAWRANPEIVRLSFSVAKINIDTQEAA